MAAKTSGSGRLGQKYGRTTMDRTSAAGPKSNHSSMHGSKDMGKGHPHTSMNGSHKHMGN